jgi:hypothetical protein
MLSECLASRIVRSFESKKVLQGTKILDGKSVGQGPNQAVNRGGSRSRNNNIIDIDQHKNMNTIVLENEDRRIRLGRNKTNLREAITEPRVPCSRRLLQAVKRALQLKTWDGYLGSSKLGACCM